MKNERSFSYFIKTYGLNSIFFKNMIKILIVFLVPILTIVFLNYNYFTVILKKNLESESVKNISTVAAVADNIIREAKQNTAQFTLDNSFKMFMFNSEKDSQKIYAERLRENIRKLTNIYSYIDSIYIYSDINNSILTAESEYRADSFLDMNWYYKYESLQNDLITMFTRIQYDNYPYMFTILQPFYMGNKKVGAVVVNIDIDNLCEMLNKNNSVENLMILFGNDIAFSYHNSYIGKPVGSLFSSTEEFSENSSGTCTISVDNEKMHIIYCNSTADKISYLSLIPNEEYQASITDEFFNLKMILLIIIIVCIGIALLMSLVSFDSIKKIIMLIDYPESRINQKNGKNEISYIMHNILPNTSNNTELELTLAKQLKNLKKATTTALQSQINSHFLCNTLDLINWRSCKLSGNNNEISKMIVLLGKLVKSGINIGTNLTTVSEEIEHTKTYISLSKIHYTDKFDAHWNVDKELMEFDIVRLTLQPIIENAVEHGIRMLDRKGNIYINITSDDKNIYITVEDDGIGMSDEAIQLLNVHINTEVQKKQKHIGLANINSRIRLIFGENYGVTVSKASVGGLKVSVVIPKSDEF